MASSDPENLGCVDKTENGHVESVQSERSDGLTRMAAVDMKGMMRQMGGMIAGDVGQWAGRDSSPPLHEFRRDSNPPAKLRMALHSFIPNRFVAEYASAIF